MAKVFTSKFSRSFRDTKTGLLNREVFLNAAERKIRGGNDGDYLIIVSDVENFKLINEMFGSSVGDAVLKSIAAKMQSYVKNTGECGRLQADKFAILVPKDKFDKERLLSESASYSAELGLDYNIVVDFGVYEVTDKTEEIVKMCDAAITAVRYIHGIYGHRIEYYDKQFTSRLKRIEELKGAIAQMIEKGSFEMYLQPICDIYKNEVVSAEALMRWHLGDENVSPSEFIPICENTGLIAALDILMLERACEYIKSRDDRKMPEITISVNLSRVSIYSANIVSKILSVVDSYKIDHSKLKIEITESAYQSQDDSLHLVLKELQKNGFKVLMDDFGTGYSSLNTLKDLTVDELKIDMAFLKGLDVSGRAGNILTSIVRMAHWLGTPVIAEGVETERQKEFLQSIGCEKVQGYYYAPPMPVAEFERYSASKSAEEKKKQNNGISLSNLDNFFDDAATAAIFNGMANGMGLYEFINGKVEIIRVNKGYLKVFGYSKNRALNYAKDANENLHPDDVKVSLDTFNEISSTKGSKRVVLRRYKTNGKMMYLECYYTYLGGSENRSLVSISFNDITAETLAREANKVYQEQLKTQHERLESIYETVPCGILDFMIDDGLFFVRSVNRAALEIFGCVDIEAFKAHIIKNRENWHHKLLEKAILDCYQTGEKKDFNGQICTANGEVNWVRVIAQKIKRTDGCWVVQIVFIDINAQRTYQEQSEKHEKEAAKLTQIYRMVTDFSNLMIFDFNVDSGTMIYSGVDKEQKRFFREVADYLLYLPKTTMISPDTLDNFSKLLKLACTQVMDGICEFKAKLIDVDYKWYRASYKSMADADGNVFRVVGFIENIENEKARENSLKEVIKAKVETERILRSRAERDVLSDLYNKATVDQLINDALKDDYENGIKDAFIIMDVDNFKTINDSYGHLFGDKVISAVGHAIKTCCRGGNDYAGRVGGDEFVAFIRDVKGVDEVISIVKRISDRIKIMSEKKKLREELSMSFGIYFTDKKCSYKSAFMRADKALYIAKRNGKNQYSIYSGGIN